MNKFTLMVLTGCAPITGISAAEKPNLVIIHTDEHSFRTLCLNKKLLFGEKDAIQQPPT